MKPPIPRNSAGLPYVEGDTWACPCGETGADRDDRPDFHGRGPMGCVERRSFSVLVPAGQEVAS
jgi:hypothetical protein